LVQKLTSTLQNPEKLSMGFEATILAGRALAPERGSAETAVAARKRATRRTNALRDDGVIIRSSFFAEYAPRRPPWPCGRLRRTESLYCSSETYPKSREARLKIPGGGMARQGDPADLRLIVVFLRSVRRWTQEELSRASGVDRGLISDYELGDKAPTNKTLARLAAGVGLPYAFVEALLPTFRAVRLAAEGRQTSAHPVEPDLSYNVGGGLDRAILEATLPRLTPYLMELNALFAKKKDEDGE
jgi:transcriptional regulator with XRE-family HTH domain